MEKKLLFGCGYLGSRVARLWRDAGHEITVVTRSPSKAADLARLGYAARVADILRPETLADLPFAESVVFAVGYDHASQFPIATVYADGLNNVLQRLAATTGRVLYISSTGVYGSGQGDWVDEASPCQPLREGGRACLLAERILAEQNMGGRGIVLRLAGLYGPGRIPRRSALENGEPIAAPADGWLNLIHVDDAAAVVLAAEEHAQMPRTYCVSDGHPVLRREYYTELARLLGGPSPGFTAPPADSPAAARAAADKRVRNERMRNELRVALRYPSYREGLAAIVSGEN